MTATENHYRERSVFVDIVAWVFIVLSGFGALISILQNLMVHFLFRRIPEFRQLPSEENVPEFFTIFLQLMPWLFGLMLVLMLVTFAASIGLYLRKNLARVIFISLMIVGIAWNIGNFIYTLWFTESIFAKPFAEIRNDDAAYIMDGFRIVMLWMSGVMTVGFSALFGWIAWKLHTPKIRREFGASLEG